MMYSITATLIANTGLVVNITFGTEALVRDMIGKCCMTTRNAGYRDNVRVEMPGQPALPRSVCGGTAI